MEKQLKCFISAQAGKETKVLRHLLEHQGVVSFDASGIGEILPVTDNDSATGRQQNRR